MSFAYEATSLCKYYGAHLALSVAAFRIDHGSAVVLTGPNGSGKSTLLRLLAFLEAPTTGELRYSGSEPRRECTLLLQEPWLLHATVFNNVVLGLKLRGDRAGLSEKYTTAMRACGFADPGAFASRRPHTLSGGEKQRIALASRLVFEPKVLLLDEPTAYVDSKSSRSIMQTLCKIREQGITIVCATHDPDLVSALDATTIRLARI